MSESHGKYDHEVAHHDPAEGFDRNEPDSKSITGFVIGSVLLLVAMILSLQFYFDKIWSGMVYENVLSVPSTELGDQRNLENWRMTHYEFTTKEKNTVRIPFDRAKALFLEEAKAGKQFYPGKATEPKPETPAAPAPAADVADAKGKEGEAKGK